MSCGVPSPQENSSPGRGKSKCKGIKEAVCLERSRNREGSEWVEQRERRGTGKELRAER